MSVERKWVINPKKTLTPVERQRYWERIHAEGKYEDVFSVTEDEQFRARIVEELDKIGDARSVLIPGCGSRVFLQQTLAQQPAIEEICCTDFEGVVEIAEQQFVHPKVKYLPRNSTALGFDNKWDAVISVTSILSESDEENRDMLSSCHKALRTGGYLISLFPTIFSRLDLSLVDSSTGLMKYIDLKRSTFYEAKQGAHQIFYTPLRLRRIIKEAGYTLKTMEIYFCDTDFFINQGAKYYGMSDEDMVIYGLFVIAQK